MVKSIACCSSTLVKKRGYAWFILVMATLTYFTHQGFAPSVLGNLTIAHQKFFNIDLQQSSLIGTVHSGLFFLLGPIASVLVKKLGCRVTQLIGGGCLIAGIGLSAFSTVSWHAFLLFGVIAAIGVSYCHIASSEIISQYFDRYKYLAFSLAAMGNHLGSIIWPLISQYLLDKYGYSKAMGIMASGHVIHIIAGICFFSPRLGTPSEADSTETQESTITDADNCSKSDVSCSFPDLQDISAISKSDMMVQESKETGAGTGYDNMALEHEDVEKNVSTVSEQNVEPAEAVKEMSLKEGFKTLLKSPKILAFLVNAALWNATIAVFFVLINDYMVKKTGLSAQDVAWGLTIAGIAKVPACLLVIVTSSLDYNRLTLHVVSVIIYSVATIVITFSHDKIMYYSVAAVWGLSEGVTITNILATVNYMVGSELLVILFGLVMLSHGFGTLALTPLCTYVGAVTDEKYSLILAGCIGIFGSVILFPVIGAQYREKRSVQDEPNTQSTKTDDSNVEM